MKFITGGCGFIGANVAAHFCARGESVLVVDNLSRVGAADNLEWLRTEAKKGGAELIFADCDIRDREKLFALVKQHPITVTCHFAGQVAATTSIADPLYDFEVNCVGTFNVCEAVRRHAPESQLIFSSTNKVYGELAQFPVAEQSTRFSVEDHPLGFDESTPLDFHSPYGCSKGAADQYVRDYHRIYNLSSVVLRLSTIYGGRQFATIDQGWIGWFTEQVCKQREFTISGTGKQVRDILHVNDLVQLIDRLIAEKEKVAGEIFNIGGGMSNSFSLLELIGWLAQNTGHKPSYRHIAARAGDQPFYVSDIRKAERLVGWKPKVTKEQGVGMMLEWVKKLNSLSLEGRGPG